MKLFHANTEIRALRALCSMDPTISGVFLASIRRDHFYLVETQKAYDYILRRFKSYGAAPDWELVKSTKHLPDNVRGMLSTARVGTVKTMETAEALIQEVNDLFRVRAAYTGAKAIVEIMQGAEYDFPALAKTADSITSALNNNVFSEDVFHSMGLDPNTIDMVKEMIFGVETDVFVPTGLPHFDEVNGGMPRGGVVLLGGQTSVGKCLHGDTKVTLMDSAPTPIRDLWLAHLPANAPRDAIGEITGLAIPVKSFDPDTQQWVRALCTSVIKKESRTLTRVTMADGAVLKCSPDHRWFTQNGWKRTSALQAGSMVLHEKGFLGVISVERTGHLMSMYDLTVSGTHAFVADGFVSHNSHLVTQLAFHQATLGYKVVVVPLEMSEKEMYNRILAHSSKMDSLRILRKKLTSEEQDHVYKAFRTKSRKMEKAGGRLTVFRPKEDLTMEQVLNACTSYAPDLIYIDYIGLLGGLDGDDQWKAMSAAVRTAKVYAGNTNRVVALAAQVSAEGEIRYSKGMQEHASMMWSMTATDRDRELSRIQVRGVKGRNQLLLNFPLNVDYSTSTLRELSPDEIEAQTAKDRVEAVRKGGANAKPDTKTHNTDELDEYTPPKRAKKLARMTEEDLSDPANHGDLYGFSTLDGAEDNPDFKPSRDNLERAGLSEDDLPESRKKKQRRDEVPVEETKRRKPMRVTEG